MSNGNSGMGTKVFSVDDLVGGFFGRLGQSHGSTGGFPRTDSESAFQEFLKRIPSASNLAAATNQLDSAAQLPTNLQSQLQGAGSGVMFPSMSIGDLSSAASLGMPRVPSLEFLKQLSHMQQMVGTNQALPVKLDVGATTGNIPFTVADLANLNASVALQSLGSTLADPTMMNVRAGSLQTDNLLPAAAAHAAARAAAHAAAMQLNQLSQYTALPQHNQHQQPTPQRGRGRNGHVPAERGHSGPSTDPDTDDNDNDDMMDPKKAKSRANRMLSNRESARRSRRRKQEHLGKLEYEISVLNQEKQLWEDRIAETQERCSAAEEECRRLREENARLRQGLQEDKQSEKRLKTEA